MKIKLWQWEWDFDRQDAELIFPLILLLLAFFATPLRREWLLAGAVIYYALYFFIPPLVKGLHKWITGVVQNRHYRCPYCKCRDVILQGYQGFRGSDEQYGYHICNKCRATSILVNDRLLKADR